MASGVISQRIKKAFLNERVDKFGKFGKLFKNSVLNFNSLSSRLVTFKNLLSQNLFTPKQ